MLYSKVFTPTAGPDVGVGAVAIRALAPRYHLRLTDLTPYEQGVWNVQTDRGPAVDPSPPHETRRVDIAQLDEGLAACEGMDAILNCAVSRMEPATAFPVSTIGAYHVGLAAAAHRILRVVQTAPQPFSNERPAGYSSDFAVPEDAPPRPGAWVYGLAKYLGEESLRLLAEKHRFHVVALRFWSVKRPDTPRSSAGGVFAMWVSESDLGRLLHCALTAPPLPSPFETFNVLANLPHAKAKHLLGWTPQDNFSHLWATRRPAQ